MNWCDMGRLPFQIKICGVTTRADALTALESGASAIGLNFYPHSKRFVTPAESENLGYISNGIVTVGVFVNPNLPEIASLLSAWRSDRIPASKDETLLGKRDLPKQARKFDWIQLHGDETPAFVKQVKASLGLPIMRALRWGRDGSKPIGEYLRLCAAEDCLPDALLIDAHVKGEYGGTGETADWGAIAQWRDSRPFDVPLVLAGGLTPDNVAEAIRTVRPDAVDTASGVESAPGRKDAERVRAFIAEAKQAFAALS